MDGKDLATGITFEVGNSLYDPRLGKLGDLLTSPNPGI